MRKARLSKFTKMRQRVENSHPREQYMQILNVIGYTWPEIYGNQYYFILGKEEKGKRQGLCLKRTVLQDVSGFFNFFFFIFPSKQQKPQRETISSLLMQGRDDVALVYSDGYGPLDYRIKKLQRWFRG